MTRLPSIAALRAPATPPWRMWARVSGLALLLTLVMVRAPEPMQVDPQSAYDTTLYEALRRGQVWGEALITTDGPLRGAQVPGYASGSIWMAMSWQIAGNLLLALLLVGSAWRLSRVRRWWALGLLGIVLARAPELAPWIAMILLGHELVRNDGRPPWLVVSAGALAFLGLSSLGHLLLGSLAITLALIRHRPRSERLLVSAVFVATLPLGWLALGQPLRGLGLWWQHAMPALLNTSALWRVHDLSGVKFWAALAGLALATLLILCRRSATRREPMLVLVFLAGAAALAWKAQALQPFGNPGVYFTTVVAAAFLLLHSGVRPVAAGAVIALALIGHIRWTPIMFAEGLGHFNRQLVLNVRMLAALPDLRSQLHAKLGEIRAQYQLPRVKAVVGGSTIDVVGAGPTRALLNGLQLRARPAPLPALVRTPEIGQLNRRTLIGENAPAFILQRVQPPTNVPAPAEDPTVQLELYRRYALVLEENGFLLWQRREAVEPAPQEQIRSGELRLSESLPLSPAASDQGLWIEFDLRPTLLGHLRRLFDDLAEPGLVVRDDAGYALHFALPPAAASQGLLVDPFLRGEVDMIRLQTGAAPFRTIGLAVTAPPRVRWLWSQRVSYRLHAVPGPGVTSNTLPDEVLARYALLNRLPIAAQYAFNLDVLPGDDGQPIMFTHPNSVIEFALASHDRRVRADFGMLAGSHRGGNRTDGVDFAIEHIAGDGSHTVLYHRHLDPLVEPDDRGQQSIEIDLPKPVSGRILLRTYNPPDRQAAWDWSYWKQIAIEPAP